MNTRTNTLRTIDLSAPVAEQSEITSINDNHSAYDAKNAPARWPASAVRAIRGGRSRGVRASDRFNERAA